MNMVNINIVWRMETSSHHLLGQEKKIPHSNMIFHRKDLITTKIIRKIGRRIAIMTKVRRFNLLPSV